MANVIEHMVYTKIKEMNTSDNVHLEKGGSGEILQK